jgi:lipopolysaccharide transport system ATP-binding protein
MKPVIEIENLSKMFRIDANREQYLSLRDSFQNVFTKKSKEIFYALKDISFNVNEGDSIGIIGKNGAGKSTLLKIISKITPPTTGTITYRGRVASLLEVGTGFHLELSGRENVLMNGSILGMKKHEIKKNFDAIVDFAGVEKFIDTPLKHYSSGMQLRLAFAVAAFLENEILIIDEVLAVGDTEFQKKCIGKMDEVSKSGRTLLFVSHHLSVIKQLCTKGIMLEQGSIHAMGNVHDVISAYQSRTVKGAFYRCDTSKKEFYVKYASIVGTMNEFSADQPIEFEFEVETTKGFTGKEKLLIRVMDELDNVLTSSEIMIDNNQLIKLRFDKLTFAKGNYKLNCILYHPAVAQYDSVNDCCSFSVIDNKPEFAHLETFDIGKIYTSSNWN